MRQTKRVRNSLNIGKWQIEILFGGSESKQSWIFSVLKRSKSWGTRSKCRIDDEVEPSKEKAKASSNLNPTQTKP